MWPASRGCGTRGRSRGKRPASSGYIIMQALSLGSIPGRTDDVRSMIVALSCSRQRRSGGADPPGPGIEAARNTEGCEDLRGDCTKYSIFNLFQYRIDDAVNRASTRPSG